MAIVKTAEMLGTFSVPNPCEAGEIMDVLFKIDSAVTPVASGDFVQLLKIPADAMLTDIQLSAPSTLGTTTIAAGLADAAATTALSTTYIAAAAITTTAVSRANALVNNFTVRDAPTNDQNIIALQFGVAALNGVLFARVQYRASKNGR